MTVRERMEEHFEEAKTLFPEDRIVGLFLQGSQNYGLELPTSDVDTKLIVVPTFRTVKERWGEHCRHIESQQHLPFYRALKKYGLDNFSIEIIEECPIDVVDAKEIYWIDFYNTYAEGYNCTCGGEGSLVNIDEDIERIIDRYQKGERLDILCKEYHHNYRTVSERMIARGITIDTHAGPKKLSKIIYAYSPETQELVYKFESINAAAKFVTKENNNYRTAANHIGAAKDTEKIRYGFLWKTKEVN